MKKHCVFLALILILCISAASCSIFSTPDASAPYASPDASANPTPEPDFDPVAASSVYLPNGAFPSSAYEPAPEPARFYKDVMLGLVANNGYGRVYPYVGGMIGSGYSIDRLYGFCDSVGRIVCDPVYNNVDIYTIGGNKYYLCTKNGKSETEPDHIMIASIDGKVVKRFESGFANSPYYGYNAMTLECISVKQNGKWGLLDGNLDTVIDFKYDHTLYLSDGLIVVILPDKSGYIYMDIAENTVLGPYTDRMFSYEDFYMYSVQYFLQSRSFADGKASMEISDSDYGYIDKSGVYSPSEEIDYNSNKTTFTDDISYIRTSTGLELTIGGDTFEIPDAWNINYSDDHKRMVISYEEGWSLMDADRNMYVDMHPGGAYFGANTIYFYLDDKTGIMDMNGNVIIPLKYSSVYEMGDFWGVSTLYDEDHYLYTYGLLDANTNEILPNIYETLYQVGDCICAIKNNTSTLVTPEGKVLVTMPLMDNMYD